MKITQLLSQRGADAFKNRPVTIACLGDSVTHGCFEVVVNRHGELDTRYAPDECYVRRLQDKLFMLYPAAAVTVVNCGVGGDNAPNACERFERDVARFAPDLVVVDLGLNDSMNPDVEAGLAAYEKAMRGIFEKTARIGAEAILLTPNRMCAYVDPKLPDGTAKDIAGAAQRIQNEGVLSRYVEAARKVAREAGAPIADVYAMWEALEKSGVDTTALLANGINHPIPRMHELFANEILRAIFA